MSTGGTSGTSGTSGAGSSTDATTQNTLNSLENVDTSQFLQMMIAGGKAAFCLAMGIVSFSDGVRWRRWLLRGALHCGVVARLAGKQEQSLYGEAAAAANLMQRPQA